MSKVKSGVNLKPKRETSRIVKTDSIVKRTNTTTTKTNANPSAKTITQVKDTAKVLEEKDKIKTKTTSTVTSTKVTTNKPKAQTTSSTLRSTSKVSQPVRKPVATTKQYVAEPRATHKTPLRAKHDIKETINRNSPRKATISQITQRAVSIKPNAVLDTPHNVTVSSPPPIRKEITEEAKKPPSKLIRKGSRTLNPEEIVVLKRESAKKRSEEKIQIESLAQEQAHKSLALPQKLQPSEPVSLKEPVAFEVKFEEENKKLRERSRSRVKQGNSNESEHKRQEEESNYSDDFESYESDFETGSSTNSQLTEEATSDSQDETENATEESAEDTDHDDNDATNIRDNDLLINNNYESDEDESELTQNPITVIQRDKEKMLDSGNYEMNSRKSHAPKLADISAQSTQHLVDSLECSSLATSDQLDSGISAYGGESTRLTFNTGQIEVFYGGYKDFNTKPILNKRGSDLMGKIQFDTLSFTLMDLKPISYDIYMQTFGKLNSTQSSTQTQDNLMDVEQQTEVNETKTMWTQHPAQYDLKMIETLGSDTVYKGMLSQNCCGQISDEYQTKIDNDCELEDSLEALKQLNSDSHKRCLQNHHRNLRKSINYEHLNAFLLKSSLVITQILQGSSDNINKSSFADSQENNVLTRVSERCFEMESNFLNTLRVTKIFGHNKSNLIITVHESLPDTNVYASEFSQLLMVWCLSNCHKPLRILTTWSQVSRVEITTDSSDIVVAALRDGSVALWDLRETYSFCSKLDGYLTHFAATQSIVPSWLGVKGKSDILMDLGSCLDVRSFRCPLNSLCMPKAFNKTQFVSLHDSGVVTIWTLVETAETSFNFAASKKAEKLKYTPKIKQKFEYSSPWARVKLIQSSIVNLKDYLETKCLQNLTRFDKTKALFQKNIYSDEALKELNDNSMDLGQQGLRFTSIECGTETIYIGTNRNFILTCSKTLKMERFRRIFINENRLLFPTAMKVLSNEMFLAVGLSNGAVMILNCDNNKPMKKQDPDKKRKSPDTPMPTSLDIDPITGKSCAIQNIVLNSQKSFDNMDFGLDATGEGYRPNTAACIALIDSKQKPFELRIHDQQIILTGSVLRRHLIQSLELSSDGWRLFALTNGHIRIYDFCLDQELFYQEEDHETGPITDIATGKSGGHEMNLIILNENSQVEVHVLKK